MKKGVKGRKTIISVNKFIWIDKGKYITVKNKMFFLYFDNTDDSRLILKTIKILKAILKITILC